MPIREPNSIRIPAASQPDRPSPIAPKTERPQVTYAATAVTIMAATRANFSRCSAPFRSARFQDSKGPMPRAIIRGIINGTKVALKKGGPTEILSPVIASSSSG